VHAPKNNYRGLYKPDVIIAVIISEHILLHCQKVLVQFILKFIMISHELEALLCRLVSCNYIAERTKYILIVSGEA
jgi:hypothetical protein